MKTLLLIFALAFSVSCIAQSVPSVKHFYITYTYIDNAGKLKVDHIGHSVVSGYPKQGDLLYAAYRSTKGACGVKIVGVDDICASDYKNLFNK